MVDVKVKSKTGTYVGSTEEGIREFLGIRFAEPVEYWKMPHPVKTTGADVIYAKEYGPQSLQPISSDELASKRDKSNDCLTLNIWTKDNDKKKKPVMVYIHGGSYVNGGNADPITYGRNFVDMLPDGEDVVMVKINYRLGIFGCADLLVLDGYTDEYENSLALHIIDQITALRWIHENIEYFGGDSDNVTLFGQSAGSMSIAYLMANEEARQYFNRGIMQSGIPGFGLATRESKRKVSKEFFDAAGIKSIDDINKKDDEFWNSCYDKLFAVYGGGICPRVQDGKYIKESFFKDIQEGKAGDISLMIGATTGEMDCYKYDMEDPSRINTHDEVLDILYAMNETLGNPVGQITPYGHDEIHERYIAAGEDKLKRALTIYGAYATQIGTIRYAQAQSKWSDTYLYFWNYMPDAVHMSKSGQDIKFSEWDRAPHCAELPVLFNSGDIGYPTFSTWWLFNIADDLKDHVEKEIVPPELARKTALTWYSFAKTGNPNNSMIPEWRPYRADDCATMFIDAEYELKDKPPVDDLEILDGIIFTEKEDKSLKNNRASAKNVHTLDR